MCLSASQILGGFLFAPESIPKDYYNFLVKFSIPDTRKINALCNHFKQEPFNLEELQGIAHDHQLKLSSFFDPQTNQPNLCRMYHPGLSCSNYFFSFLRSEIKISMALYAPIHGAYGFIILIKKLIARFKSRRNQSNQSNQSNQPNQPNRDSLIIEILKIFYRSFANTLVSAIFLTSYCATALKTVCFILNYAPLSLQKMHILRILLAMPGLALFLEHKPRRLELALYCLPRALESLWKELVQKKKITDFSKFELILFCIGSAFMSYCHHVEPGSIKPIFETALAWLHLRKSNLQSSQSSQSLQSPQSSQT
eukprot:TRINITY_DN1036_c1_g1_i1.p1 TRINITY_DN1036_c1_g1~~TRINITY_DN1036_c1_g1_i1.p1  ORF type:complete len:311 (+),score=103.30 TRINITY_DN1036_c1_g1_i1:535-1467(+)